MLENFINIIIGGGLFGLIQFLINRHDNRQDRFKGIEDAIKNLSERIDKLDERECRKDAMNARYRILRFDDELRNKQKHSLEYFQEISRDIDSYELYCKDHEDFKNTFAVEAIENIKRVFRICKEENNFI